MEEQEIYSMLLDGSRTRSLKRSMDLARSNIINGIFTKPPTDYPFLVKGKHGIKRAVSPSYKLALAKILALFPNKYIKTKHAKAMDLITARAEALKLSKKSAHKQFVILVDDEFEVENTLSIEEKADIHATFYKGQEVKEEKGIKLPPTIKTVQVPPSKSNQVPTTKQETAKRSADIKAEVIRQINSKEMKKALESKPSNKVAAKKVAAKSKSTESVHARFRPIVGGAALDILNALKKKAHTKEELAKIAKTQVGNISWYIGKIKNNGHKVELGEKGYSIKK
jgi:hypothetical protein